MDIVIGHVNNGVGAILVRSSMSAISSACCENMEEILVLCFRPEFHRDSLQSLPLLRLVFHG